MSCQLASQSLFLSRPSNYTELKNYECAYSAERSRTFQRIKRCQRLKQHQRRTIWIHCCSDWIMCVELHFLFWLGFNSKLVCSRRVSWIVSVESTTTTKRRPADILPHAIPIHTQEILNCSLTHSVFRFFGSVRFVFDSTFGSAVWRIVISVVVAICCTAPVRVVARSLFAWVA